MARILDDDCPENLLSTTIGFLHDLKDLVLRYPIQRFDSSGYANSFSGCLQFLHLMNRLKCDSRVACRVQEMVAALEDKMTRRQDWTFSLFSGATGDLWLLDKFLTNPPTTDLTQRSE
jgi:hypothetical protein